MTPNQPFIPPSLVPEPPKPLAPQGFQPGQPILTPQGWITAPGERTDKTSEESQRFLADMRAAGIDPASKEGRTLLQDWVKKKATHPASPSATANVKVEAFTPASEEAQKEFMKSSRVTFDQLKSAPTLLQNIERAKELIPKARGFMGTGGETMLDAAKFLNNRLGLSIATEGIKSAEELRSRIFFNIMDNLKKMDAQPSQMQQQIMMDSLGKLGTDPNALGAVLDAYADTIMGKVSSYNVEVEDATNRGVKFPYNPVIKLPEVRKRQEAKPQTSQKKKVLKFDAQGNLVQ